MSEMPREIWAAQDSSGSTYWLSEDHAAIDNRPHAKGRNQTHYTRTDTIAETLDRAIEALELAHGKVGQATYHIHHLKQEHVLSNDKMFAKSLSMDARACISQALTELKKLRGGV